VTYRIGQVDERFGVSRSEFSRLVKKAAEMWSVPFSADLFQETSNGRILIEMIYDHRQDASKKLARLNTDAREDLKSYKGLKGQYDKLQKEYKQKNEKLERDSAEYNRRARAFKEENAAALHRGRVSEETHQRLQEERAWLNATHAELQRRQKELKDIAVKAEQLVPTINSIAGKQQDHRDDYHKERERLGGEFEKGVYHRYGKSITVYQYTDKNNLVQLLAHELGHALGIRHINDPNALMYPWDTGKSIEKLAPADIAALRAKCKR
jgi:DNA repair exonuclease SbcCD ATPase subunit